MNSIFKNIFLITISSTVLFSCKTTQIASKSISEDLSAYRIVHEIKSIITEASKNNISETKVKENKALTKREPVGNIDNQLLVKLDQIKEKNKEIPGYQGYKIQVFSGLDRKTAESIRLELLSLFNLDGAIDYDQPNFRVKTGAFLTKVDAHELYVLLKANYPSAKIVSDRVVVDKSFFKLPLAITKE